MRFLSAGCIIAILVSGWLVTRPSKSTTTTPTTASDGSTPSITSETPPSIRVRGIEAGMLAESQLTDLLQTHSQIPVGSNAWTSLPAIGRHAIEAYTSGSLSTILASLETRHVPPLPGADDLGRVAAMQAAHATFLSSLSMDATKPIRVEPYIVNGVERDLAMPGVSWVGAKRRDGMACHDLPSAEHQAVAMRFPVTFTQEATASQQSGSLILLLQWNKASQRWEQVGFRLEGFASNAVVPFLLG